MNSAGGVVLGRSLTWPSPSSTTRQTPSARRARSTVTNGSRRAVTARAIGTRSSSAGWQVIRRIRMGGLPARQAPSTHQVRASGPVNVSNRAQDVSASELVIAQLTGSERPRPRRRRRRLVRG